VRTFLLLPLFRLKEFLSGLGEEFIEFVFRIPFRIDFSRVVYLPLNHLNLYFLHNRAPG